MGCSDVSCEEHPVKAEACKAEACIAVASKHEDCTHRMMHILGRVNHTLAFIMQMNDDSMLVAGSARVQGVRNRGGCRLCAQKCACHWAVCHQPGKGSRALHQCAAGAHPDQGQLRGARGHHCHQGHLQEIPQQVRTRAAVSSRLLCLAGCISGPLLNYSVSKHKSTVLGQADIPAADKRHTRRVCAVEMCVIHKHTPGAAKEIAHLLFLLHTATIS